MKQHLQSISVSVRRGVYRIALVFFHVAALAVAGPPETRRGDTVDDVHGLKVADPYRWLENTPDPEVIAWMAAQNDYVREYMSRYARTRATIYAELENLFGSANESIPRIFGTRYFVWRRDGLRNQPVLYVRNGSIIGEDRVVLDPNVLSHDGSVGIDWAYPSPDGMLVAYGISTIGTGFSRIQVRDLIASEDSDERTNLSRHHIAPGPDHARFRATGQRHDVHIDRAHEYYLSWEPDNRGFHYARDATDERAGQQAFYHRRGWPAHRDQLIFEDAPPGASLEIYTSSDNGYTIISCETNATRNDLYFRLNPSYHKFKPLVVGVNARFSADIVADTAYILTDHQAPRSRMMKAALHKPAVKDWKEIVPEQDGTLRSFIIVGRKLVLHYTDGVYSKLVVCGLDGGKTDDIPIPDGGVVCGMAGRWDGRELYFSSESPTSPRANYRYDVWKKQLVRYWQQEVSVDTNRYASYQIDYVSSDGTRIPMLLAHRKDVKRNGKNPTLLRLFVEDHSSGPPAFDQTVFPWLDRGGIIAVAHVRGDGAFGREWTDAGRLANKHNALDDFAAAAKKLINDGYTNASRLAVAGRGAAGLPALVLATQHPELVGAAVFDVPMADMMRYGQIPAARQWFCEFGSPDDAQAVKRLIGYSPYHNIRDGVRYPAVLLATDQADTHIGTMHAWKMAACLQAATGSKKPILVHTLIRAGRGTSKPLRSKLSQTANMWTFLMAQLGMIDRDGETVKKG